LDIYRIEATQTRIGGIARRSASSIVYNVYQSYKELTYLETDSFIEDGQYVTLSPDAVDYRSGRFTFDTGRTDNYVYLSGFSHDPYAAAYALMTQRAAQKSEDLTSFSGQNGSFSYAAISPSVQNQASKYWGMSRAAYRGIELLRTDVNVF
jgi:hypothetical protein